MCPRHMIFVEIFLETLYSVPYGTGQLINCRFFINIWILTDPLNLNDLLQAADKSYNKIAG